MAHFAELDQNNKVLQVLVVANEIITDDNGENEQLGISFLETLFGHSNWKQTSYNHSFRGSFAGKGYEYRSDLDAFIPPKPSDDAVLDEENLIWIHSS